MLDEVGGLTFEGWGGRNCIKCLKGGWNEKMGWVNKSFKGGSMLVKNVGA